MERNWKVDPGEPSPQDRSIRSAARQLSISCDGVGLLDSIEAPASSTLASTWPNHLSATHRLHLIEG